MIVLPVTCAVTVLGLATLATPGLWRFRDSGPDTALYARYGGFVSHGLVPYSDFFLEYPPGALAAIVPPAFVTHSATSYSDLFVAEMLALLVLTIVVTAATLASLGMSPLRMTFSLAPLATAPLLLGSVGAQRYDLFPALLTAVALLLTVRRLDVAAGAVLGLGTAAKFYPALILPVIVVLAYRRGGLRRGARAVAAFAVSALVIFVPFVSLSPDGIGHMLRYQLERPLQMETLGASVAMFMHVVGGFSVGLATGHGSTNLGGGRGQAIGLLQGLLAVGVLVWIVWRTTRRAWDPRGAVLCAAAITCATVALGRILSPQFVVWLLPMIPLVDGVVGVTATACLLVATGLTRLWYDRFYGHVVQGLNPFGISVLLLRNTVLLGLLGLLLVELAKGPASRAVSAEPLVRAPR